MGNTSPKRRNRPWRALVRAVALAAALLAGLAALLPLAATALIGPDVLKEQARAALSVALARPVEIRGGVSLAMAPWPQIRAGDVVVSNSPGFTSGETGSSAATSAAPFMTVESISIGLKPAALLGRRMVADGVFLSGAVLNLARDAFGQENWRFALPAGDMPQAPDGWRVEALPTGVHLKNARLTFADARSGLSLDVSSLNLKTTASRPFRFSLSCEARLNPLGLAGELHAEGVGSHGEGGSLFVQDSRAAGFLDLPGADGRPGGPKSGERLDFSGKVAVHGEGGAFEVAGLIIDGLGARITGQVNAAGLYDEEPYIHLDLAAKASQEGAWTGLLGLAQPSEASGAPERPEIRAPQEGVEAELVLASTPKGWMVRKGLLRDGLGSVSGTARHSGGEFEFNMEASGLDLGRWLPAVRSLLPGQGTGFAPAMVRGRFSGKDLRLGQVGVDRLELNASGRDGQVRVFPFTLSSGLDMASMDLRYVSGDAPSLSGSARLTTLAPRPKASANGKSGASADAQEAGSVSVPVPGPGPGAIARLTLSAIPGPSSLSGRLTAEAAAPPGNWTPAWLPEQALKAWSALGGSSLSCAFETAGGVWKLSGMDLKTSQGRLTGTAEAASGKTLLDLQADTLDLDRLRPLAAAFGNDELSWPVEGKFSARRVTAPSVSVDDLLLAFEATRDGVRLGNISGTALGGRFSGSMDFSERGGKRSLAASLSVSGVQAAQVCALRPGLPRLDGPLEGRVSLEATARDGEPLWQSLHAQADMQLGKGAVSFSHAQGAHSQAVRAQAVHAQAVQQAGTPRPWPVGKASASLKVALKKPPTQGHREAALADVTGTVRVESPGMVRSSRLELKGQAGLDSSGAPLWFRQPRLEGEHVLSVPFLAHSLSASWSAKFEADLEKETFSLPAVDMTLAGVPGRASLSGRAGKEATELSGSLDIPEFNPRAMAPRLGLAIPAGADPNVWRRASLSAALGGSLREIRFDKILATLDDAVATGQAVVTPTANRLDLSVTTLDLDRLSPAPVYPDPAKRPEEPVPVAQFRELALDARVRLGWLKKNQLVFQNAQADLAMRDGRFHLRQQAPDFYGGSYSLDIKGDARAPEFKARMELSLKNFHPGPLLRDLAGADSIDGGRADFWVAVDSQGNTDRQLRRKASGAAGFEVRGGVLGIRQAARQPAPPVTLTGDREQAPPPPPPEGLAFTRLGAGFTVREGWAVTRDFVLAGKSLSAKGYGWVTLDDEHIDLNLLASVPDVGEVPVRISGSLYDPRFDIDKSKILGDTVMNIFKGVFSIPGSVLMQLRRVF